MKRNKYNNMLEKYLQKLVLEEKSRNTVEKYNRDIRKFLEFIGSEWISKDAAIEYKKSITAKYKVSSANSMLVAVNNFLEFCNIHANNSRHDCLYWASNLALFCL